MKLNLEKINSLKSLNEQMLSFLDPAPRREGIVKTPERFAKALAFLTSGYEQDLNQFKNALFDEKEGRLVIVKGIDFFSLCEHHMLPFFGVAHIAYLPGAKILGLSKFARAVNTYARRLQTQERLTRELAEGLIELLDPKGLYVTLEASHMCMMMRGVEKQGSKTITNFCAGTFCDDHSLRQEALQMIVN